MKREKGYRGSEVEGYEGKDINNYASKDLKSDTLRHY